MSWFWIIVLLALVALLIIAFLAWGLTIARRIHDDLGDTWNAGMEDYDGRWPGP